MNSAFKPGVGIFNAAALLFLLGGLTVSGVAAPMASVTILRSTANPTVEGTPVTFVAGVNLITAVPGGTITLTDTFNGVDTVLGSFTLDPVTASGGLTTSALTTGLHSVVASYNGDGTYAPSASQPFQQTILSAFTPTLSTLVAAPSPSNPGQSVTFTATIVPSQTGTTRPTGTVTFYDGTAVLGTASVVNAGGGPKVISSATFQTASLSAGSHNLQAVYAGDNVFSGSTSPTVTQVVQTGANPTMTALTASTTSATAGQAVVLIARVGSFSFSGTPTGTVSFIDGESVLGQASLDATGQASLTTSYLAAGKRAVTAAYRGDATFAANASAPLTVNVQPAQLLSSAVTVAATADPVATGDSISLSATVVSSSGTSTAGTPTGTVTFLDGSTALATVVLQSGVATLDSVSLGLGVHVLSANYNGDRNYAMSSGFLAEVVNPPQSPATSIVLSSSSNPSSNGQAISFTAGVIGGGGIPSGAVTFILGTSVATLNLDASGVAVFTTSVLPAGTTPVSAAYSGNALYAGSASRPLSQSVITPGVLTITASSGSMVSGGVVPTITPSFAGFVDGNTISLLVAELTCSTTATSTSPAGEYPSSCSGAADGNYTIDYVPGTITVTAPARPPVAAHPADPPAVGYHSVVRTTP